ncbi:MAG: DUF5686 family protein [Spirosomataceae bacterium]
MRRGLFAKPLGCFALCFWAWLGSHAQTTQTAALLDSLDRVNNQATFDKLLLKGYTHQNRLANRYWSLGPLLANFFQYNTVEGFVLGENLDFNKGYSNGRFLSTGLATRYGLASQQWYNKAYLSYLLNREHETTVRFEAGRFLQQFNERNPISQLNNTVTTLLGGYNYAKYYERSFGVVSVKHEALRGVTLTLQADYEERNPLSNTSDYSFKKVANRHFTSNNPQQPDLDDATYSRHRAFFVDMLMKLNFDRMTNPSLVVNPSVGWKYPVVLLRYRRGIPSIGQSAVDFHKLELELTQRFEWKQWGETQYALAAGAFLSKRPTYFIDYFHFAGNQSAFSSSRLDAFFKLDYYAYSSNTRFLQMHVEHHFNGYFLGKIPLFKKLQWHELVGLKYLHTPDLHNYMEMNIGLENIFKFYRFDWVSNLQNGQVGMGVRFGVTF